MRHKSASEHWGGTATAILEALFLHLLDLALQLLDN
jgi:hypothetical protein